MDCTGHAYTAGGCLWEFSAPKGVPSFSAVKNRVPIGVVLCDSWCKGYYHFTHEHLPRLALVHELLTKRNDSYLVLSHTPTQFQKDFLFDILGFHKSRVKVGTHVADVAVYPMPLRCGNTFTHVLYMIRDVVFDQMELDRNAKRNFAADPDADSQVKLRVLWAERRKGSRMASNFDDLKKKLVDDFDSIAIFDTTVGEHHARVQIAKFFHSDIVIGPHGANIANIMWMQEGTAVIEMASKAKANMCYYTTASRLNLTYHLMLHSNGKDAKYTLEYSDLKRHFIHAVMTVATRFNVTGVLRGLKELMAGDAGSSIPS